MDATYEIRLLHLVITFNLILNVYNLLPRFTDGGCMLKLKMSVSTAPGLFHRAVLLSGSLLSPWAVAPRPDYTAAQVAARLSCPQGADLAECLRRSPLSHILNLDLSSPRYCTALLSTKLVAYLYFQDFQFFQILVQLFILHFEKVLEDYLLFFFVSNRTCILMFFFLTLSFLL